MRKKVLLILISLIFLFGLFSDVYAKTSSGGRSSGRSSSGYSGSSKSSSGSSSSSSSSSSKSSNSSNKPSTGSSSSGYSGSSSKSNNGVSRDSGNSSDSSSSRSIPGSTSSNTSSPNISSAKKSYMEDYYKKEASKQNYRFYTQNLNDEQKRVYDSSLSRSYNLNNRMSLEESLRTRPTRISNYQSRPIIVNVNNYSFGGPLTYGSAFVGPWDLWFLMRASEMFWFHHWSDISPYRDYFEAQKFAEMERRIKALESQQILRDPNYLDPDVDYDLQFSNDYQTKHASNIYSTTKYTESIFSYIFKILIIIIILIAILIIIRKISKRRKEASYSRIY